MAHSQLDRGRAAGVPAEGLLGCCKQSKERANFKSESHRTPAAVSTTCGTQPGRRRAASVLAFWH